MDRNANHHQSNTQEILKGRDLSQHNGGTSLLVTHWSVYSAAAVDVSTGTFQNLDADPDLSHAEALRRSVLTVLNDPEPAAFRSHPSYWAPFAVVGVH